MTLPALTNAELAQVKVYAGAAALNYHNDTLPEGSRVDLSVSFAVHGDLRLVAADVLEAVCLHASKQAAEGSGGVKRIKVEGEVEVEKFAKTDSASVDANTWCQQAARLRQEVSRGKRGGLIRSPVAGIRTGSSGGPAFTITPRGDP